MRLKPTFLTAAIAALVAAAPAAAEPQITTTPGPTSSPFDVAVAADGRVWFSDEDSRLVRIESDGSVTPFAGGFGEFQYAERIARGADGNLWSAVNTPPGTTPSAILRTTPAGETTAFPVPRRVGDITAGPGGNVWFTTSNGRLAYMTPAGERTDLGPTGAIFTAIAAGSDGNLWVGTFDGTRIERVTPSGDVTPFDDDTAFDNMRITGMTLGPDGAVWFSMTDTRLHGRGPRRIGRITPAGEITTFQSGIAGDLGDIAAGVDGNLWVTERGGETRSGRILRMTPAGEITAYADGLGAGTPGRIVAHPDGSLWFTLLGSNEIGRIGEPPATPGPSDPEPGGPGPVDPVDPPASDARPTSRITAPGARVRQARRKALTVRGTASDDKGVARVHVSIVRRAGKRCESLTSNGRWKRYAATGRKCSPRLSLAAKGTTRWSLALRRKLPKGTYVIASRATDNAGQGEAKPVVKTVRVLR